MCVCGFYHHRVAKFEFSGLRSLMDVSLLSRQTKRQGEDESAEPFSGQVGLP